MQLFLIMGNSFLDKYLVKMKSNRKKIKIIPTSFIRKAKPCLLEKLYK